MSDSTCPVCSGDLPPKPPTGPRATYCSRTCRSRASYQRLAPKIAEQRRARCLEKTPAYVAACAVCGTEMQSRRPKVFCSPKCSRDGQPPCSIEGCDRPRRANGVCNPHYRLARRAAGIQEKPQPWDDARRDAYHRRRALKKQAETGQPVVMAEIVARDKGRCHLCGNRVPDLPWPHKLSPSLDHVVPLSKGGEHDPANVRLAHLFCNLSKGNRGGGEQLLLVG